MKITLMTERLLEAVAKLGVVTSSKDELVISIEVFAKNFMDKDGTTCVKNVVSMKVFNGKTQVASSLIAESAELDSASVCVTVGYEFIAVVTAVGKGGAQLTTIEINNSNVVVKSGVSSVTLAKKTEGIAPIAFDLSDKSTIEGVYEVSRKELKEAVDRVVVSVDSDSSDVCPGISFFPSKDKLIIRSANHMMMTQAECTVLKYKSSDGTGDIKMFATLARMFRTILASASADVIRIYKTTLHVIVQFDMQFWQLPLLNSLVTEEVFKKIISMPRPTTVTVDKTALLNAIGVVLASYRESKDRLLALSCEGGCVMVANADKTASTAIAPKNMEGEFEESCLNVTFIKNILGSIKTNDVTICFGDGRTPLSLRDCDADKTVSFIAKIDREQYEKSMKSNK